MRSRAEDILQKAAASWLDRQEWLWAHVPNERETSPLQGGQLRAKGVKSGVPDILIFEPITDDNWGFRPGIALELKVHGRQPEPEQRQWLKGLAARGWITCVCRSRDEVKAACGPLLP